MELITGCPLPSASERAGSSGKMTLEIKTRKPNERTDNHVVFIIPPPFLPVNGLGRLAAGRSYSSALSLQLGQTSRQSRTFPSSSVQSNSCTALLVHQPMYPSAAALWMQKFFRAPYIMPDPWAGSFGGRGSRPPYRARSRVHRRAGSSARLWPEGRASRKAQREPAPDTTRLGRAYASPAASNEAKQARRFGQ